MNFWNSLSQIDAIFKTMANHMEEDLQSVINPAYFLLVTIYTPLFKEIKMTQIATTVRADQILTLAAEKFGDVAGNAVTVTNPVVWTIDNPALGTLTPSPDGTTVVVTPSGALGNGIVTSTVNSNPNAATPAVTVIGSAAVSFTAGLAVVVNLTATVSDSTADQTATAPAPAPVPPAAPEAVAPAPAVPVPPAV